MKKNIRSLHSILKGTKDRLAGFHVKIGNLKKNNLPTIAAIENLQTEETDQHKVVVEISAHSVARSTLVVLVLLLLFYFLYQISTILLIFFVSFLLAAALDPIIGILQAKKIPRSIGVLVIYLIIFFVIGLLFSKLVPLIAKQAFGIAETVTQVVQNITLGRESNLPFAKALKPYFDQIYQAIDINTAASQIQSTLLVIGSQLLNISFGLLNVVMVLVLTFFMTVEEKAMEQFYLSLFPSRYGHYISSRLEAIKQKIGYWLRGQLLLSVAATILSYVGLLILNVDYALTLAVISGIMMVIPVLGRIFALVLTVPIVMNQSPLLALWVSIYYLVLQQIEGNILVPYIMNKVVGLSPIILTFAMLVGAQYLGVLGLIISIPIATSVGIFVKDYMEKAK